MYRSLTRIVTAFMAMAVVLLPAVAQAKTPADRLLGLWLTRDHDAVVEFYKCGGKYCGRFYWLDEDPASGDILRDEHNHDEAMRQQPVCRMTFMRDFTSIGGGVYENGSIYNPEDGWQYNGSLTLTNANTLTVHGYVLFALLGQDQVWTRVASHAPCQASL